MLTPRMNFTSETLNDLEAKDEEQLANKIHERRVNGQCVHIGVSVY